MDEHIAEEHRELVARYREAEKERPADTVWPARPDAVNRVVVFDTRPRD